MRFKLFENLKMKGVVLTLISVFSFSLMHAQTKKITGSVTDEKGEPLIGVSIMIQSTKKGTITDFDGKFEVDVNKGDNLVFDYLGYSQQKIKIKDQAFLKLVLIEDAAKLEEVVLVGYGLQKKKEVIGAVARVDNEELEKISTADVGSALQGAVAGVNVVASSGEPGEEANVQIRGISSVDGNNRPLYIVDGIPFEGDPKLSPSEIETIDVLKDAASASIYGTRGAAGVILISTKKGKEGVMKVSLNSSYGVQKITSGTPLLDAEGYMAQVLIKEIALSGNTDTYGNIWTLVDERPHALTNNSNFIKVIENDYAPVQTHNLNISGGKDGLSYSINANYFNQEGVLIKTDFERYNVRANTQYRKGKWNISTGTSFRVEKKQTPPWGLLRQAISYNPLNSQIDLDNANLAASGDGNAATNLANLGQRLLETNHSETQYFDFSVNARYNFSKNLSFTTRGSASFDNVFTEAIRPNYIAYTDAGDLVTVPQSRIQNLSSLGKKTTWESILNYKLNIYEHSFNFTAVYSAEQYKYSRFQATRFDLFDNSITTFDYATGDANTDSGSRNRWTQERDNTLLGALGRLQYNYAGRYLFGASVRRDGSSRFREQVYGVFPSFSLGWNVSSESFWMPVKAYVPNFKLRASRGTTGNQNIEDYTYTGAIRLQHDYVFGTGDNQSVAVGAIQQAFSNPKVVWETSISNNFGIDLGFLKNKLTVTADIYKTTNEDMLFPVEISPSNGGNASITRNVGNMKNIGQEIAVNYKHSGKFSWRLGATFTRNRNTITKLSSINDIIYLENSEISGHNNDTERTTVFKEGYEAGAFFLYKTAGVVKNEEDLAKYKEIDQTAQLGDLMYVDTNGDGEINVDDKRYMGSGQADFEAGLNFSAYYKGVDLSVQLYGSYGADILNGNKALAYKSSTHRDLLYQWSPSNTNSNIPINRAATHTNYSGGTDYFLEDGSYLRVRNIMLGYTIPKKVIQKIGLRKLRFYVAAQNPLTFTKYTGYDPEVGGNGVSTRGIDKGSYPVSAQFRGGLQLQF